MPLYPSFFVDSAAAGYQIEQSLRFNSADGAYLNRTPSSAGNRRTWTWSGWVKKASIDNSNGRAIFGVNIASGSSDSSFLEIRFGTASYKNSIAVGGYTTNWRITSQVFRDSSAWYHLVVAVDTTQATGSDRIKIYVNGSQITAFASSSDPALNADLAANNTHPHWIGRGTYDYLDGYLAEVNFIDGSALDPTNFGEYDNNGVWRPIRYAGSYTGNSFYLKFASGDGTDSSGLSNTWTANNFTTSGTGTDVMSDTPTTNWCTFNPLSSIGYTLSNGNLDVVGSSISNRIGKGTFAISSGKWYWEAVNTGLSASGVTLGICSADAIYSSGLVTSGNDVLYYSSTGNKLINGSSSAYGSSFTTSDVIGIALDADADTVTFYKNNTSQGSISITSGVTWTPCWLNQGSSSDTATFNFGQRAFAYTPPTGFNALNTSNLPAPDIADGSDYFNTVLYTGTSSTQSITGVGFQPDLAWIKRRDSANSHALFDAVRGAGERLSSNETTAEIDNSTYFTSFDSDGFSVALNGGETNLSGATYAAWNWLAGGSGSSNTAGSITSTVSVNPTAGFSIVSYTGGGAIATVGHGLGVAPKMIIVKRRDTASYSWNVYHESTGNTGAMYLDATDAFATDSTRWNNTSPTSTVFTIGSAAALSASGGTYIAYCFAEVEGYSKFGSYTGNGSSDGPFVYCGFKPAFVMIKRSDSADNWWIHDASRDTYNPATKILGPNLSNAESSLSGSAGYNVDFLSNGFKVPTTNVAWNASGGTYIFAAFAENPFGGSGVSPATAR